MTSGPAGGGTSTIITGTGFSATIGNNAVTFGTAAATVTAASTTQLTVTTPATALTTAGAVDVNISVSSSTAGTLSNGFTYNAPTVTGVSPSSFSASSGGTISITGTNFTSSNSSVSVGGTAATGVTLNSSTSLTATAPSLGAGSYDVVVTTGNVASATSASDKLAYLSPPTIAAAFSPTSITTAQTSTLTLTLTNPNSTTLSGVAVAAQTLPAGFSGASPATSCGGTAVYNAGSGLSLSGGSLSGNSSCTVTLTVSAATLQSAVSYTTGTPSATGPITLTGTGATSSNSLTVTAVTLTTTQAVPTTSVTANTAVTAFTPVTASGGFGTVTYALSGATLPTGLSFANTTGQITGTPTTLLAATTFTVTATDQTTPTAQTSAKTFSLTVTAATLTTTQAVPITSVTANTAITAFTPVTASGGFGTVTYALSGATLPTGLSFSTTTGQITGTPTTLLAATTFTVTATDQTTPTAQTSAKTFSLTVTAATLTTTQAVPTTSVTTNAAITAFTPVTASGGFGTVSYALSGATLPTGLSFSTTTGQITGTPTTLLAATTFTVTATDQTTPTAQTSAKTFSLTVTAATLTTTQAVPTTSVTANTAITAFTPVTASGGFGTITYALSGASLPTGLSFATATGQITGTPTTLLAATTFTVTATDQTTPTAQTSAKTFSLAINATTLTTTQAVPTTSVTTNTAITAFTPVTSTGGFGTVTYALSGATLPTGLSFATATGQITGTPTTLLAATTFTVTATDQTTPTAQTSAKTFSLAVTAATLATTQAVPTTSLTVNLAATPFTPVTSTGGFGTITYALSGATLPTGLSFSTTTGQITGTPTTLLAATTFTVTATDQTTPTAQTSAKTFSLAVTAATLTTTQAVPTTSVTANTAITAFTPVTASGGFGTITYALSGATLPTGLSFATTTGQITGTPTTLLAATTFTVTATDQTTPTAQTSAKTFSLAVTAVTLTTTQAVPTTSLTVNLAATPFTPVTASGGFGTVTYALFGATLPTGLSFSTTTGQIAGTPTTLLAATTFTVTATDQTTPTAQTSAKTFSLAVVLGAPANVVVSTGNNQSTAISTVFATQMSILVTDASNNPISNASVIFTAPTSGASGTFAGSATTTTVSTNASGIATATTFTAGATAGSYSVTATVSGVSPASFSLTNVAGTPTTAQITGGNNQSTPVSTPFGSQLTVAITDNGGNPLSGVNVTFTAPGTGASGTFSTTQHASLIIKQKMMAAGFLQLASAAAGNSITVQTNTAGMASVYFNANGSPGSFNVVASAGGLSTSFTLANTKAINAITFSSLPNLPQGSAPITLTATATSGDTVIFTSSTPSVCTVSGSKLTLVQAASGTCTIVASDPGNSVYAAATPVTQSFQVNMRPDPSKDPEVIGLVTAQTEAAEQFAQIQLQNYNSRLEQMHGEGYVADSFGITLTDGLDHNGDTLKPSGYADDIDPMSSRAAKADQTTGRAMRKQNKEKTDEDKAKAAALDRAFSFWTAGAIQVGRIHSNNTVSSTDLSTGGLSAGVDYRFSRLLSIGFGLGYGSMSAEIGSNGTTTAGHNYDAVLYASIRPTTYSFIDLVGGAGLLDFSSNRYITGIGSFASGKRTGREFFGSATAGIEVKTKQYMVSPYLRFDAKTGTLNAFDENGPAPWALHYDKETFSTASVNLGLKAAVKLKNELDFMSPFVRAEFQHDLINNTSAGVTYVDLVGTGTNYTISLPGSDSNRIMLGLGTEMTLQDFKLMLEYINTFSTSSTSDASTIRFKVSKSF